MNEIFKKLKRGEFDVLESKIFSESDLNVLSGYLKEDSDELKIVKQLITQIPQYNRNYDWNAGSIIQHLDIEIIINVLRSNTDKSLLNSIGLAFALGELKTTDRVVTDFLYQIVKQSKNSDAWWRAAFSLEKLGIEEAVNLLKASLKDSPLKDLEYCLSTVRDKKSVISILMLSNVENIEQEIYPRIKNIFLTSPDDQTIVSCCWLIGRLRLIDRSIYKKLIALIGHDNYELKYYTFFALQNNATETLRPVLESSLKDNDPLIRKMAARGIMNIGNEQSLDALKNALFHEKEEAVISELSKAIYGLKNPINKTRLLFEVKFCRNENGMISDESDKWYHDPSVYHAFSEAEDPENICFALIQGRIKNLVLRNPVDLATGTGRMAWQIVDKLQFMGNLYAVDSSKRMCQFVEKAVRRERKFTHNIKVINATIEEAPKIINEKSSFVISSFGFPSKIFDKKLCLRELKAVYDMLENDGLFCTIGWDETFNDELSRIWFRFIPDNIAASNFEDWRRKRMALIESPRNCDLSWFKKGIMAPLQFSSLKESVDIMSYLFGRDAAEYVIKNNKTEWSMSLGITCNTKEDIGLIFKNYERS